MVKIILAQPRGFCAGVIRAIDIVDKAIERAGAPVYVRHEIVHNRHVVDKLKRKGAVFVEDRRSSFSSVIADVCGDLSAADCRKVSVLVRGTREARYGDFILMKPPVQPNTWLLWLAPLLVLGVAGTVAWATIKKAAAREA